MTATLAARLQKAILTLWTQLDIENGCLPSRSCSWLLGELEELQETHVPAGYASSAFPLGEAVQMLQATHSSPTASLSLLEVTSLTTLLNQAVALLASPSPPSTAHDSSRPTLPSEIISLILHQLAAAKRTSDVAACCLVSKSFLPLAREALYHTLYLTIEDQERDEEEGSLLDLPTSAKRGSDLAINYGRLAAELALRPHLGSLVREVHFGLYNNAEEMDLPAALVALVRLLESCSPLHVQVEGATRTEVSQFFDALWEAGKSFRSVELDCVETVSLSRDAWTRLWRMLEDQTALQKLSLNLDGPETFAPATFAFALKELRLVAFNTKYPVASLLKALTPHSAATLTRLSLRLDLSHQLYICPHLSHFKNLQTLGLFLEHKKPLGNPAISMERDRCHSVLEGLPPSLKSMILRTPPNQSIPPLVPLQRLPSTLLSLDIRFVPFSPPTLLAFLRSRSSHLRRFKYATTEVEGGKVKAWSASRKAEVELLLEELGIEGN
ncbi:hypothetical protein BCR35DRAFT_305499 [Leucosporidium creatinivorum]|uniref:Uncharacterized protein n=1 Tax=Leucosporidium creatinivorum TaxID=106004 RepID=A0A1Y2F2M0_9BASI|nr:hypothetical protein BCR35DRAFT_305499 [Leucosporidium creatinivorum]